MKDGLYINNTWVSDVDCSLTFQGNDLTKPDARTASYSNSFTLPDSQVVRDLMQGGEQIDAGGPNPYRQLPAFVIDEGERTFEGVVEFVSFSAGWKVNLLESVVSFFDAIKDKMLTKLDLSRLNHPWTLQHITALAGNTEGVVYPMIDYGGIDAGIVPYDTMCPSVYAKTIFGQICKEAGYKPVGDWLTDPFFEVLALPFVGADPKAHDDQWIDDRTAKITANGTTNSIKLEDGHTVDMIIPFSVDSMVLDGFTQGKLKPFKTDRHSYVCPNNMRLKIQAQIMYVSIVRFGAADIEFILEKNGQQVAKTYYSKGGYYDGLNIPEIIVIDETIDCVAGDELQFRLTGSSRTNLSDYAYYFSLLPGETWVSFIPDGLVHLGDTWPVAENLPADISCSDLVLTLAKAMCGTFVVDDHRKTVKFSGFDEVINNIPDARDWSLNVDESTEPDMLVQFDGYGANNICKWKEADEKKNVGYGDGVIPSPTITFPKEETLFELPFMACIPSENQIGGYGNPVLIKTRSISRSGDTTNINKNDASARLVLIEPTKTVSVQTRTLTPAGDFLDVAVTLTACWWAIRPVGAKTDNNAFSLAFLPVLKQTEQPLIDRYFKGLKRVLRRPRMLTASFYLQPTDIATLDLSVPIRLQKVRVGSIEVNDNTFYLNKLGPYRSGMTCTAVLIAI